MSKLTQYTLYAIFLEWEFKCESCTYFATFFRVGESSASELEEMENSDDSEEVLDPLNPVCVNCNTKGIFCCCWRLRVCLLSSIPCSVLYCSECCPLPCSVQSRATGTQQPIGRAECCVRSATGTRPSMAAIGQ